MVTETSSSKTLWFDVWILTHGSVQVLCPTSYTDDFTGQTYDFNVLTNEDYLFTNDDLQYLNPERVATNANPLGAFRGFRGHQECIRRSQKAYTLILEYDAVPLSPNWLSDIKTCQHICNKFDVTFFHLRHATPTESYQDEVLDTPVVTDVADGPIIGGKIVKKGLGALAYMISPEGKQKFLAKRFDGWAADIYLVNETRFAWLSDWYMFDHDDRQGSLTDNPV
jgi:hypothetical protein